MIDQRTRARTLTKMTAQQTHNTILTYAYTYTKHQAHCWLLAEMQDASAGLSSFVAVVVNNHKILLKH